MSEVADAVPADAVPPDAVPPDAVPAAAAPVVVVGIGADGWAGLAPASRAELERAQVLLGSRRQLALLPPSLRAERVPWPSPLSGALPGILTAHAGRAVAVLASGDPMLSGIGTTLTRLLGVDRVRVLPAPSSVSLACARLDGVDVHGDPVSIEATGMAARCLRHEVDHLNGRVYVDLLPAEQRKLLLAEAAAPEGELPA